MRLLMPFTPHIAAECLENLGASNVYKWPKLEIEILNDQKANIVIQINGKTRNVIKLKKDTDKNDVLKIVKENEKIRKFLENKSINKIIFIKNKIVNFVIKN